MANAEKHAWMRQAAPAVRWIFCVAATIAAVWLHLQFRSHAGGLWRDEVGGFNIATLPEFSETWERLTLDSSPLLSPLLLRSWGAMGLGTDGGLRTYGLLVGLAVLAAFWVNAWALGSRLPLISLLLLAGSASLVRWGDSVRAYGLGCLFLLLTLGAIWRLAERPSWPRYAAAALLAVLSVQTLYQNAFFLLAMGLAAAVVMLRRRAWRGALMCLGAGVPAALSLLPYVPAVRASSQNWWVIQKTGFQPGWVWFNIELAAGSPYPWMLWIWILAGVAAVALGLWRGWRDRGQESDLALFSVVTLVLSTLFFMVFIRNSGLPTQAWYYIPLLVVWASCANAVLVTPQNAPEVTDADAVRSKGETPGLAVQVALPVLAGVLLLAGLGKATASARYRATNLDLIAEQLRPAAAPGDLIVLHPWYCGVTFLRYHRPGTEWATVPPMPDLRVPRFDLFKEMMATTNPMPPLVERCRKTLRDGGSLWLIGWFRFDGQPPGELPPAPHGPGGWNEVAYEDAWAREISFLVTSQAIELLPVPVSSSQPISPYENLEMYRVKGWRTNAPAATVSDGNSP